MMASKNNGFGHGLSIQIPRVKNPIPLFIIFRALGILSDKDICQTIVLDTTSKNNALLMASLQGSIVEANKHLTQDCAILCKFNFLLLSWYIGVSRLASL